MIDGVSATFLQHRLAGRRVDPDTQFASTQGRLRAYETTGIDSRLTLPTAAGELQAGVKLHHEEQDRQQINGSAPTARSGARVEDNSRETVAWSAFAAHRFTLGNFTLTPVTRYEAMEFERLNRLNGLGGRATLDRVLPGLGATWQSRGHTTVFASVHRGFAPPRVEDLVGGNGTATDVGSETSLNSELGVRFNSSTGVGVQAAVFRHDFDNLIAVGSIAWLADVKPAPNYVHCSTSERTGGERAACRGGAGPRSPSSRCSARLLPRRPSSHHRPAHPSRSGGGAGRAAPCRNLPPKRRAGGSWATR